MAPVFADDGFLTLDDFELDISHDWAHEEGLIDWSYKGLADVTVTNTGDEAWGDFHFEFYDPLGGQDISNLSFFDTAGGGVDPTSTQSGLTWTINNTVVGATIDLFFYSDPVLPSGTANFTVYTDNTTDTLPWFGMQIYATPVPEPATIALLALGGIALMRKRRA
jgi:hypothetical protein